MAHRDIQGVHREYSGGLRGILSVVADLSEVQLLAPSAECGSLLDPPFHAPPNHSRIFKGTQRGITMLRTSPMLILSLFFFPRLFPQTYILRVQGPR